MSLLDISISFTLCGTKVLERTINFSRFFNHQESMRNENHPLEVDDSIINTFLIFLDAQKTF
jgi:hypothetical protein